MNMKPEIVTLDGKPFAILPLKDFERLVAASEEAEDIHLFDAAMARKDQTFPSDLVARLLKGESPIKTFREYRGLSQQTLAKKAGITRPYLAAIEGGSKSGSVSVLKAVARALQVDLDTIA